MVTGKRVKVTKDGPYLIYGGIPLSHKVIECDEDGYPLTWRVVGEFPPKPSYSLCRCGHSGSKPYCDGSHIKTTFNRAEVASRVKYLEGVKVYNGPELKLTDKKELCTGAGFCTRAGNIWNLTVNSDNPELKQTAIQEAHDCPSGRLVVWDKDEALEPALEPGLAVTETSTGELGPIWAVGGVVVESADGFIYETRNRVTLCRCGKSDNMPLCDGSHIEEKEKP